VEYYYGLFTNNMKRRHTFSSHAHLETLSEAAVLALVPVVLVDGAVPVPPTRVRQVPPNAPLEEALAS
jgi:hypothetical protein